MHRRNFSRLTILGATAPAALLMLPAGRVLAQTGVQEGKHYLRLDRPQPVGGEGRHIEVLEFFSYGCHACNALEPELEAWARRLPADVQLRRVPVPFLANAQNYQRTYYALEAMGLVDKLQRQIFGAIHVERRSLDKVDDIAALVGRLGGEAARFHGLFQSFAVTSSVARAKKQSQDYGIQSIPTLAVQGRFTTSPAQAGDASRALAVVDALIERVRKG